ncbi:DsbC family protein [Halomonas sp. McH1-25]|uniref:DsbC family protein n=1 Tax=unclassified Halomonas TaxID=2609666 RepID=UPI001EF57F05|nr:MULTISPECIES: DsbC family protein [unclassified Halomonas]MCG7601788.1 DsbC family protein [Halomonas sp. McH1-25]MCP1343964.1 DsbC family protein [Halomonas sp. FL8]MCP1361803.1 DsbC family protein [Halomonas sp. BBD45]MCP1364619.1 DsbC family protein [Halomonas sp. BBD48]
MKRQSTVLISAIAALAMLASSGTLASSSNDVPEGLDDLTLNGQAVTLESVRRVELEGPIYEVRLRNGDIFYSDAQGRHMVVGTLYDNSPRGLVNVTELNSRQDRLAQLDSIHDGETVDYPAQGEEIGVITVFTDTSCPYCQKLHQEIDQLTAAGIAVRYVPYPRAGSQSPVARQMAQVLCSDTSQDAMSIVFSGGILNAASTQNCQKAVDDGFRLGQRFGVKGTPTIVLPSGEMKAGYIPAEKLVQLAR